MSKFWEIEVSRAAFDSDGGYVVSPSRHFGSRECSEPYSGLFSRLSDFGYPFAPAPFTYAPVNGVFLVISVFTILPFNGGGGGGRGGGGGGGRRGGDG
ncbi:hypothetical protein LguiA_034110 [Lonicera macranthoides]